MSSERKSHWEKIYHGKATNEMSWYQPKPITSIRVIENLKIAKSARIIDVGGGDSLLVDHLLDLGYTNITVLDISEKAIQSAKNRLGTRANNVHWIEADVASFTPHHQYDFWHDRAAFHFLIDIEEIDFYVSTVSSAISVGGFLVIGTFSLGGPKKCSGLEIQQYSSQSMFEVFKSNFDRITCTTVEHITPVGSTQEFVFCSFQRNDIA